MALVDASTQTRHVSEGGEEPLPDKLNNVPPYSPREQARRYTSLLERLSEGPFEEDPSPPSSAADPYLCQSPDDDSSHYSQQSEVSTLDLPPPETFEPEDCDDDAHEMGDPEISGWTVIEPVSQ